MLKYTVTLRSEKIMKHILVIHVENDVEVYHETDVSFNTYVQNQLKK
jgi:hypothetical protein